MNPGRVDQGAVRRYLLALDQVLAELARHTGRSVDRLRPLAGFRNVLVHGYLKLDLARVHEVLNVHLDDIREFATAVDAYVNASSSSPP